MPSPFPGVDPFIESQHCWPDFHATFLPLWRKAIRAALPRGYHARLDERLQIIEVDDPKPRHLRPDVAVFRRPGPRAARGRAEGGVTTIESVTIPLPTTEEIREIRVEITHRPTQHLVAVLELLSPANKNEPGRSKYLEKRGSLLQQDVHLVEVDLLLGGRRLPMGRPLPPGDFFTLVARSNRRPNADVFHWTLRQPLPVIPIPLLPQDGDITVDLGKVFSQTYEDGGYVGEIDYGSPLELPLDKATRHWAMQRARSAK